MPFIPLLIMLLSVALVRRFVQKVRHYRHPAHGSLILSDVASPYMAEIARGQYEDLYFSVLAAFRDPAAEREYRIIPPALVGSAIYRVDLPFITQSHMIGVPKQYGGALPFVSHRIEQVVLEGDFPKYFSLYAEKGQQVQTRYLLDPAAMQYIIEFGEQYYWEIIGDQLVFLQPNIPTRETAGDVLVIVKGFIEHIRPAAEISIDSKRHIQRAAYGEERRTLLCPLCASVMSKHQRYLLCPLGHGMLAYGGVLSEIRSGALTVDIPNANHLDHKQVRCPSCRHDMVSVQYDATGVMIDTCSNCPYRWLDAHEVSQINAKGKRLDAVDIGRPQVMTIPEPQRFHNRQL